MNKKKSYNNIKKLKIYTLATPYPLPRNLNKQGTTTAGDTAATILPIKKHHIHSNSNKYFAVIATTEPSTIHGNIANFGIVIFCFLSAFGSKSRPARVKIITNAIFLNFK